MRQRIVAFGHRKGTGKDTAASFAVERAFHHSINRGHIETIPIAKASFASRLKVSCYFLFGWAGIRMEEYYERSSTRHLKEEILPAIGKTPRQIWIEYGMAMRAIHEDIWIDLMFEQYSRHRFLAIADLRFPNEAKRLRDLGAVLVRVDNPGVRTTDDVADNALAGFTDWDHVIVNTPGDPQGMRSQVNSIVDRMYDGGKHA